MKMVVKLLPFFWAWLTVQVTFLFIDEEGTARLAHEFSRDPVGLMSSQILIGLACLICTLLGSRTAIALGWNSIFGRSLFSSSLSFALAVLYARWAINMGSV
jgi:hypothetical protein